MVSPQNPATSDVSTAPPRTDRGFIEEDVAVYSTEPYSRSSLLSRSYPVHFWGAVIAGSLLVISLFVLSYTLMIGCHVGVAQNGLLAFGWGTAVWLCVTSAIAFYFGGMLSNCISRPLSLDGWIKGASVWGLTVPLSLVIGAVIAGGSGLLTGLVPRVSEPIAAAATNAQAVAVSVQQPHPGLVFAFSWALFVLLIIGLIFSILGSGSIAGAAARTTTTTTTTGPTT